MTTLNILVRFNEDDDSASSKLWEDEELLTDEQWDMAKASINEILNSHEESRRSDAR